MGEVVQLFKKLTVPDAKEIIIDNLKNMHHGKYVNRWCTINHINDYGISCAALNELISESKVEVKKYIMRDVCKGPTNVVLYRYSSFFDPDNR